MCMLQKKNYERLQKALDSVMSIREMTQVTLKGSILGLLGEQVIKEILILRFSIFFNRDHTWK